MRRRLGRLFIGEKKQNFNAAG